MNRLRTVHTAKMVTCPFCRLEVAMKIEVGFTNRHGFYGRRITGINIRRTAAVDHDCVDPTSVPS